MDWEPVKGHNSEKPNISGKKRGNKNGKKMARFLTRFLGPENTRFLIYIYIYIYIYICFFLGGGGLSYTKKTEISPRIRLISLNKHNSRACFVFFLSYPLA